MDAKDLQTTPWVSSDYHRRWLANEAEELGRLVSRFQVEAGAAPLRSAGQAPRKALAMKVAGGRGVSALRKPEPVEDGWEEF